MRTKKTVILLLSTIVILLAALMLCSCSLFGGDPGTTQPGENSGKGGSSDSQNEGWKTIQNPNIYNALIKGCTNVAYLGSQKAVETAKGVITVDSKIKFTLDGASVWIIAKAKYKSDSPRQSAMVSIEISSEETPTKDSRIVSLYVYNDALYVALGNDYKSGNNANNKVKFSLRDVDWTSYFPYAMEKPTTEDTKSLTMVLNAGIKTNKANVAESRRSVDGDECRYSIDVDLDETITQVFEVIPQKTTSTNVLEITKKVKEFVAVFYGVTEKDIADGKLPQSNLTVNFRTLNDTISYLDFAFDIDMTGKTMLFSSSHMIGSASVEKLTIGNNYQTLRIPFVTDVAGDANEIAKYIDFGNTVFTLSLPLEEYETSSSATPGTSLLKVTAKLFQGDADKDFLFAEYSDRKTKQLQKGLYVYNNVLYFYSLDDVGEFKCIGALDIKDSGKLATALVSNDIGGNSRFEPTKLLAYVINGVSVEESGIRFSIKPNFYTDVWYNFDDMCAYFNSFTSDDILANPGIRAFYDYVKTNEVIVTMGTHDSFFEVIETTNDEIAETERMLRSAPEDVMMSPAE